MSISRVGTATGTTTCAVPTHSIGDLIVIFAYRSGSTTAPTLPSTFTSILTISGTSCSARLGYRIATSTSDASGTWTNATALVCHVYTSSLYSSGGSMAIGGFASTHGTSLTVTFPALTMTNAGGTSWASGFAGVSNTSQTIATAPSGMTNESQETASASQAAGFDTNGTVSSWSSTNATDTGTAGDTASCTLEICENAASAAISTFIDHVATQPDFPAATGETCNNFVITKPNASLASNTIVCVVAYPSGNTPAITDNQGNTWPTSGGTGTVTADAGAGNMALQAFVLNNAATGTQQITIGFGSTTLAPVRAWVTELTGVTGTIEGHATAAAVNTAGVVTPGSFTPSANDCLVLSYMSDSNTPGTTNPALIRNANGYFLNDADISWNSGAGTPSASQAALQGTAAATAALFNINNGGTETYNVLSFALSTGSQGTPKPSGIHVDRILYFSTNDLATPYPIQIPSTGNLGFLVSPMDPNGTGDVSATDSDSVSWTNVGQAGGPLFVYRPGYTGNPGRSISLTFTGGTGGNFMLRYFDVSGAATAPFDTTAFIGATDTTDTNSLTSAPSITPSTSKGLVIAVYNNGIGPTLGVSSPSGAIWDEPLASVADFVGGISSTTLTISSTTWGAAQLANAVSGTGVTAGTTIQSGSGPTYTIQPSQTVSTGTTMVESCSDTSTMNWGNGLAHFYNPNTNALSFNWNFANQPGNEAVAGAISFKAAPAAALPLVALPDLNQPRAAASRASQSDQGPNAVATNQGVYNDQLMGQIVLRDGTHRVRIPIGTAHELEPA